MKTIEVSSIQDVIQFLNDYVIECKPEDNCGRCDDGRECVKFLSQFKSPLPEMLSSVKKTLFMAGYKACEGGWNIQKAQDWFDKTYGSELRKRNDHVTMRDMNNDDTARQCRECGHQNSENCNTCDIINPQFH